ncbi:MAG: PIN domain-containing protein [Eubacteriales bacterium]|nr:PIN domain-containing protein [Eubacteriales bacterium]
MAKIYYIDSENVGDSWIELLEESEARFLVFYTGHSPRIAYPQVKQLMNASTKPEFIECHEGNNGLDFQLVTYLGYELHADNTNEMMIVSNDTGFDAVVSFWSERGMNVSSVATIPA